MNTLVVQLVFVQDVDIRMLAGHPMGNGHTSKRTVRVLMKYVSRVNMRAVEKSAPSLKLKIRAIKLHPAQALADKSNTAVERGIYVGSG